MPVVHEARFRRSVSLQEARVTEHFDVVDLAASVENPGRDLAEREDGQGRSRHHPQERGEIEEASGDSARSLPAGHWQCLGTRLIGFFKVRRDTRGGGRGLAR
jgi:hypothetical protein